MELSFNTRLSVAFLAGLAGLVWQGIIATVGGHSSPALIGAFSTITLATIGIGMKKDDDEDSDHNSSQDNKVQDK